jgi:hypothetical protein
MSKKPSPVVTAELTASIFGETETAALMGAAAAVAESVYDSVVAECDFVAVKNK